MAVSESIRGKGKILNGNRDLLGRKHLSPPIICQYSGFGR